MKVTDEARMLMSKREDFRVRIRRDSIEKEFSERRWRDLRNKSAMHDELSDQLLHL